MGSKKRTAVEIAGSREGAALAATLGGQLREARIRRRLTQPALGRRVGLRPTRISEIELGKGTGLPLGTWVALGLAVGRPVAVTLSKPNSVEDGAGGPIDGGHLAIQEILLERAAAAGRTGTFELPTRPADPARSVDVCIRDEGGRDGGRDRGRWLIVAEAWNDFRDLGAAARSFRRKLAEAESLAVVIGASVDPPYRVAGCWVIRSTARNRGLVARYPHVFGSLLPGSSAMWVRTLVDGGSPPGEPAMVWCDLATRRIFARRWRDADPPASEAASQRAAASQAASSQRGRPQGRAFE